MISHLVDEAAKKVGSTPLLVNIVSKRVRQLNAGHKPMVDIIGRMGLADIALKEIIEGKLIATVDEMGIVMAKTSMSPVIYEVLGRLRHSLYAIPKG